MSKGLWDTWNILCADYGLLWASKTENRNFHTTPFCGSVPHRISTNAEKCFVEYTENHIMALYKLGCL